MKFLDIIVNPTAGGKRGKRIKKALKAIEDRLNERQVQYKIHFTEEKNHGIKLTEQVIKQGATNVVMVGGDGTLHEVINGFCDFERVNLGIIPCGTGNDFASALGLPKNPVKALDLILDGQAKYTDYMQMPTVRGMNIICMGIDVLVLQKYQALKRKNKLGYTKCLVQALMNFEYSDFVANIDGEDVAYRSFIACVANGNQYGGGIPIAPPANPTDNQLDFVAVKEIKKGKIPYAFLKLKAGKILTLPQGVHKPCTHVKVTPSKTSYVNVDGELYYDIPLDVQIVSNTLKVYR